MKTLTIQMILKSVSTAVPGKCISVAVEPNSILGRALSARTGTKRPIKTATRRK